MERKRKDDEKENRLPRKGRCHHGKGKRHRKTKSVVAYSITRDKQDEETKGSRMTHGPDCHVRAVTCIIRYDLSTIIAEAFVLFSMGMRTPLFRYWRSNRLSLLISAPQYDRIMIRFAVTILPLPLVRLGSSTWQLVMASRLVHAAEEKGSRDRSKRYGSCRFEEQPCVLSMVMEKMAQFAFYFLYPKRIVLDRR